MERDELLALRENRRCVMNSAWIQRGYFRDSVESRMPCGETLSATIWAVMLMPCGFSLSPAPMKALLPT